MQKQGRQHLVIVVSCEISACSREQLEVHYVSSTRSIEKRIMMEGSGHMRSMELQQSYDHSVTRFDGILNRRPTPSTQTETPYTFIYTDHNTAM